MLEIVPTFRVQWEEVQNCYVVLYPEGMVKLSQSAGEIMKRIDGEKSVIDIIDDISNAFDGADVKEDVMKFLEVVYGNGWIRSK
ncbi:MAG: pyrroloquinoline quinone biosynthesis peptide chaperone PqqD [Legionellales bacterium]|nr:pyrroloquinoline quinone biosynthesis peptide chaperone PqqD [Legionellales bacterium]HBH10063.1 pyrroloquinoline quinone biosynthesis peptide chaperone PqqD [Gammaproteobacteria bacterium]